MSAPDALILVNEALLALGESPLDDLEGDSAANTVARLLYQSLVDEMLGSHPWVFNRRVLPLPRLLATIPAAIDYAGAYQLPSYCFRVIRVFVNSMPEREWEIVGSTIYCHAELSDVVELEYHTRVDESLWRPSFRSAVVMRLAAEFCIGVTDDSVRAKLMHDLAQRQLAKARHQNATEHPAMRLPTGRLSARRAL